jgi:hypothetical protein
LQCQQRKGWCAIISNLVKHELTFIRTVYISYHRLQPTGNAYVQFTHPDFVPSGVKALQNSSISSFKLDVLSSPPPAHEPIFRSRGSKGREEAAGRGVLSGLTMEGGGVQGADRSVVLWGLPGKLSSDELFNFLNSSYKLSGADTGKKEVYQVELYVFMLVRMGSYCLNSFQTRVKLLCVLSIPRQVGQQI